MKDAQGPQAPPLSLHPFSPFASCLPHPLIIPTQGLTPSYRDPIA